MPIDGAARRLKAGALGAIYAHRMEFGPSALGARTILANPARRETHDLLNVRLERCEFMPFAPVIQRVKAGRAFNVTGVTQRACRYMTIACDVRRNGAPVFSPWSTLTTPHGRKLSTAPITRFITIP
jgi:carbamoyltransferase